VNYDCTFDYNIKALNIAKEEGRKRDGGYDSTNGGSERELRGRGP